ncbi:hypothetical protein [Pseudoduganella violacea]|uniref:Membrane-bound inhibitor of C-type lysozyme n=1 Tax=Pseudoduganella violacea TaxID=1715466 RepID=A0A7W5B962_9BURK|nr:hypothetical protein [Pseudoduganella violacea]MBB3118857.1 membrane-bound inhibitor of C-type lysozyme [Pseudoduganella violacea]
MSISKLFLACSLALGSATLCLAPAVHAEGQPAAKAEKKPAKRKAAKAAKPAAAAAAAAGATAAVAADGEDEAAEPSVTGSAVTEFACELGNKVTIYQNNEDENFIALRWKKRLHRLKRVATTTGAQRFENKLYGLVWIGIPAKSMLLDSKQSRQLANECKSPEQNKPAETPAAAA